MGKTADILKTKIVTHKDQMVIVALTAAITAAVITPIALAANDTTVSANEPVTSVAAGPSCDAPVAKTTSTAKKATTTASTTTVNSQSGNSGSQNANSGQGNANNTTGGSAAANGNNQSNTGGLIGGVNAIVPVSALNNNSIANGNSVSVLSGSNILQTVKVPVVTSILSTVGVTL